ncbi:MAG TPA: hypothetical protein ENI17_01780 [Pseudomonas xinjiangensis]|uniref:Uncharacterized protein n=2 Tax=root TaxID=1 RepID=A0A7V1BQ19_9GAMM|nr:hypothetical protein [Halopseudomonas xinjiangensis]HEC46345.1 hypothetical protein [Halopseudomonas xinjiangensis]
MTNDGNGSTENLMMNGFEKAFEASNKVGRNVTRQFAEHSQRASSATSTRRSRGGDAYSVDPGFVQHGIYF